jgi:hypothetical protein
VSKRQKSALACPLARGCALVWNRPPALPYALPYWRALSTRTNGMDRSSFLLERKAVGSIQEADRSGYVRVQFESLMMPDGATVPIQAVATDLDMRPLKGKVEGKNTGKNILVRSLSGIGQAGALLLGQSSLNQPLSESDLMRERVSNNIGEASDEQISRMAITSRIVVTVPADTPIYVVLEETPKADAASGRSDGRSAQSLTSNAEELRQLLQLKRELNQSSGTTQ